MKFNNLLKSTVLLMSAFIATSSQAQTVKNHLSNVATTANATEEETPNPLSFVAEYNTNADGSFATGDVKEAFGDKFTYNDIFNINIPEGYHIPAKGEMMVISGEFDMNQDPVPGYPDFGWEIDRGADEEVILLGDTLKLHSHYLGKGDEICYGIRFKGGDNKFLSAFRWRPLLIGGYDQEDGYKYMSALEVRSRLVGPAGENLKPEDVAKESFWNNNNENDVVKYFPTAGYGDYNSTTEDDDCVDESKRGRYWSKTMKPGSSTGAFSLGFDSEMAYVISYMTSSRFSLRLFKDYDNMNTGIHNVTTKGEEASIYYDGSSTLAASRMLYGIDIYDITGSEVFKSNENSSRYFVNLNRGVYVIKYKTSNAGHTYTMKIIIK